MSRTRNRVVAALCVGALAGGGVGAAAVALTRDRAASPAADAVAAPAPTSNIAAGAALSVAQIVKQAASGVVEIDSTSTSSAPFPGGGGSSAEGTGFVYDEQGDIVTNAHVVDGASSIAVKFPGGKTVKARLVGEDVSSDLAVLKVDVPASGLTVLRLADSSSAAVGDGVVAIGNPFGLTNTVTTGIVSALDREISAPDQTPISGVIQTDAAINPGNSGGPLLDLSGRVIGVNSQIKSNSGGNDGVGFAIPANTVKSVAAQLISTGKVEHALLGVTVRTAADGVAVSSVQPGSGAADGGVRAGDVITGVDGTSVATAERLRAIVGQRKPGDRVSVKVRRAGTTRELTVTLGSRSS